MQMRAYVMRLRRRGVVHVAADVAVVVLGSDLGPRHAPAVGGNLVDVAAGQGAVGMDDARDVLGAQEVLRLALAVVSVGVDVEHMVAFAGPGLFSHTHAGRNCGSGDTATR